MIRVIGADKRTQVAVQFERNRTRPITDCGLSGVFEGGGREEDTAKCGTCKTLWCSEISNGVMDR